MNEKAIQNKELTLSASILSTLLCISFGSNVIAIKISLNGFGPLATAGLRFSIASIAILLWAIIRKKSLKIEKKLVPPIILLGFVFSLQLSLYHIGISQTYASRAALIINSQPFFILLLAHFFIPGDQATFRKIAGMTAGFAGVAIIFLGDENITSGFRSGDLLVLCTSFIWAVATIYTKKIINNYEPHQIVFYTMLISTPIFLYGSYLWDMDMVKSIDIAAIVSIIYQGLITGSLCYVLWTVLLQKYGAVSLHSYIFITPAAGVTLGGLILGEVITLKIIISLILIVSGIVIINFKKKPAP